MDQNNSLQKIDPEKSLKKLSEDSSLAKRGLRDIGIWPKIQILLKEIEKNYFDKNYTRCIELCDEVLKTEPLALLPLCYKAFSFEQLANYEEALLWYDKALQTEISLEETPSDQKFEKENKVRPKFDFEIMVGKKAFSLLRLERYDEAIDCLNQALKIFPDNYINLSNKGFCLEKLGKINEAVECYEKSLVLQPSNDKYYDFQGSIDGYFQLAYKNNTESDFLTRVDNFYDLNEKEISFLLWNKFLEEDEKNLQALLQKARNLFNQEKYTQAIDIFSICIKKNNKIFYAWQFRGDCYWKKREFGLALEDYLKSIELDPTNGVAYDNAAMCSSLLGNHAEAHKFIDKSIEIQKQTGQRNDADMPMLRKAQIFEYQGKIPEALEQYKKTLNVFPNSSYALNKISELGS
ncbi:tetratricopeptide repeat protein [Patescibacteria group bacterium]|nr:tetratricopeptide repeat protein [Patescibacteria group bacterium]